MDADERAAGLAAWRARFRADGTTARLPAEVATWPPLTDAQRVDLALLNPAPCTARTPAPGMPPDTAERRPAARDGAPDDALGGITTRVAGCPCGCQTRPHDVDDPACIRRAPLRVVDWPAYDVVTLGLAPHDRATCERCQAVGA